MGLIIHQSEIKTWLRCRLQHDYKYNQKLEKVKKSRPLIRGTVIHRIIEEKLEGRDPWKPIETMVKEYGKLFREEEEIYGDLPHQLRLLMENYFFFYRHDKSKVIKWRGKRSEHEVGAPLNADIRVEGIVDDFIRKPNKLKFLEDHKSRKQIPVGDELFIDLQTAIYVWIMDHYKMTIDGIRWNFIKAKTPVTPEVLKTGELSRRKNIATTWPVYKQAIRDNGLKIKDYTDMKEILEPRAADFFVRHEIARNDRLIEGIRRDFELAATDILINKPPPLRSMEKHCEWCDYKGLCRAELMGQDTKWMKKHQYKPRLSRREQREAEAE